ncbi:RNA polymerase sigma factor [Flavobacterium chungangense]|uniref:RNA polymerase sigma-70 factor n=1 Tax=Flavobacterium chungangense TaxID=554283 RepID=A0A6V6Z2U0_9FLAO|nr:sigma-70 family RNA polymerase sigma factor [Flavobacterium chungangense]CAD0005252.1 RNA polymerase sigma-70 factor [Flavobacterium chungangense]
MKQTDSEILVKLKKGDASAYKILFDQYYDTLCIHSMRYCDSYDMAQDIVQDIFVDFWNEKRYLKIEDSLGAYLHRSVRNNSVLEMRKHSKFVFEELDDVINKLIEDEIPFGLSPDQELMRLKQEIDKLPNQSKEIFKAIVLDDKKYKEVAEFYGISVNTVKTQYGRALKKLRNSPLLIALLMLK